MAPMCTWADTSEACQSTGSTRLTLVDVDGVTFLVAVWARTDDDLAAWLPVATPIVDSIRFQDLPRPSSS
jgi:hypothetical protein